MTEAKNQKKFNGRWKICEMELWDCDYIDMVEEGYIEFKEKGGSGFHFGCVYAQIDCSPDEESKMDFSFEGDDEGQEVSGRGWVKINDNKELIGLIAFHQGDKSRFKAIKI
jgi:hypothetical protein